MTTNSKHSFRFPSVPVSAPTTPAYTRISKSSDDGPPPVTPQRIPRAHRHQNQLQNYFRSPLTPASTLSTPFTPLSLRSSWSSNNSTVTTPVSVGSAKRAGSSLSPEALSSFEETRLDLSDDWRSRANENGIKVASGKNSHFMDHEGTRFCGHRGGIGALISITYRCIYASISDRSCVHLLTCLLSAIRHICPMVMYVYAQSSLRMYSL